MAKFKIAWLPGDGVGNEVMDCARIVKSARTVRMATAFRNFTVPESRQANPAANGTAARINQRTSLRMSRLHLRASKKVEEKRKTVQREKFNPQGISRSIRSLKSPRMSAAVSTLNPALVFSLISKFLLL